MEIGSSQHLGAGSVNPGITTEGFTIVCDGQKLARLFLKSQNLGSFYTSVTLTARVLCAAVGFSLHLIRTQFHELEARLLVPVWLCLACAAVRSNLAPSNCHTHTNADAANKTALVDPISRL